MLRACVCRVKRLTWGTMVYGLAREMPAVSRRAISCESCAAAVSGLTADAKTMVEHGRVESQNHYFTFNEPMPVESLCQTLCRLAMSFGGEGEKSMSRPFGVALLVAGYDEEDKGRRHN